MWQVPVEASLFLDHFLALLHLLAHVAVLDPHVATGIALAEDEVPFARLWGHWP
jgi:hypothetical protein